MAADRPMQSSDADGNIVWEGYEPNVSPADQAARPGWDYLDTLDDGRHRYTRGKRMLTVWPNGDVCCTAVSPADQQRRTQMNVQSSPVPRPDPDETREWVEGVLREIELDES